MGISIKLVESLRSQGHDINHLGALGLARMEDADVMKLARAENRMILTADLDFGELLAIENSNNPSVITFRLSDMRAETLMKTLGAGLECACT